MALGRPAIYPEIGTTGLRRSGGVVIEEFLPELSGRRGMKVYREMRDNSAIVGACLGAIEMLIRQVEWRTEPASQDPEDLRRAVFVESCRHDMSFTWAETVSEILTMLPYGFAFHELVYKRRGGDSNDPTKRSKHSDGLIGWRKLPIRAQETLWDWDLDENGGIQAMRQVAPPNYAIREISIEKGLLFRARAEKNNPEGRSILRNAYFSWYFSKRLAETEAIGVERDLNGVPVGWVPAECFLSDATAEQKASKTAMDAIVRNVRNDEQAGITMPVAYDEGGRKLYDITLLTTGGRRNFDTTAIIERYDRRIAVSLLYDLLMMGQPNTIQYKGKNLPDLFATALCGWLDVIRDIMNAHAIPRLYRLNGWSTEGCARLCHGDVAPTDLAALGDFISKISGAGMQLFPDGQLEADLRRKAGLPEKPEAGEPAPVETDEEEAGAGPDDTDAEPDPGTTEGALLHAAGPLGLRPGHFAKLIGYSRETVRKWIDSGSLRSVALKSASGERRIPVGEAVRFAKELGVKLPTARAALAD